MSYSWLEKGTAANRILNDRADIFSDGNVRYYEYEGDSLHFLTEYKSADPRTCFKSDIVR